MKSHFEFDIITAGLNGKKGLMRKHWTKKKALRDKLTWMVLEKRQYRHKGKVKITYIRHSVRLLKPMDNLPASAKMWIDALRHAGVIVEDNNDINVEAAIEQKKVSKLNEQKTIIIVEDIKE